LNLIEFAHKIEEKYNWIIIDSIGLPALGQFAVENLQGKGNILLHIQAILYRLKIYSAKTGCYIFTINQPTSEMNKTEWINYQPKNWNRVYKFLKTDPFGDKIFENNQKTITDLIVWKSRKYPKYTTLARITRSNDEFKWEVLV